MQENYHDDKEFEALCKEKGEVPYGFTNDYMFRAVLQTSEKTLRGLLSSLLSIPLENIVACDINNPIILGEAIDEKTCILDLNILLNNNTRINLEMQVGPLGNWTDRSLYYLCRMFTKLKKGEDYADVKQSIHIGILTKQLFPDNPGFYSEYALLDTKSHYRYSSKFAIRVLDLSQIDAVPTSQRTDPVYMWASLLKAQTWEEMMHLAEGSEDMKRAIVTLHKLTDEEKIQLQCEARERYRMDWQSSMKLSRAEGRAEAEANLLPAMISNVMDSLKVNKEEAMDILKLSQEQRNKI